jgi:mono/diheme cytochrome c family protein
VESRCRLGLIVACMGLAISTSGCSDALNAGPLQYVESEALTKDLGNKTNLYGKPNLQNAVRKALADLYGPTPQEIKVPKGAPLPNGGAYLGNYYVVGEGAEAKTERIYQGESRSDPNYRPQNGGYALYRRNCLHCHGVSGAGDGPTAAFLYPVPRDYRAGIFKFTSTPTGLLPHRNDLRQTITYGLHGTSMPAFESLLTATQIEEVIDYVMFLTMRGQTESELIGAASQLEDNKPEELNEEIPNAVKLVFSQWTRAQNEVVNPPIARTEPTRESILRGRDLFLASDCKDCHGRLALGNGESFVKQEVFNDVVFGGNPSERQARLDQYDEKTKALWKLKPDSWGNPLRPANLNRGIYKGGRRPIDIYWRIAKGINGAQMPAHYPSPFDEKKMWDVVNFVLALPYEPELLKDAPAPPPSAPAVAAGRGSGQLSVVSGQ